MNEDIFQGYKGDALALLKKYNVRVWGTAEVETTRGHFSGTILPRAENDDAQHIVMKIVTGYNIGIDTGTIVSMKETGYKKAHYQIPEKAFPYTKGLPHVKLLGTGGTIASRLDYRTGAVIPAFSPGELYGAVPELADICNLDTEKIFAVFSENMGPTQYVALAKKIGEEIEKGVEGIVIGHGTDTLHHTGAALTFMCQNLPIPVVLVGSQRSSDRPSSDAALNLMHAMTAAGHGNIAEVMVCSVPLPTIMGYFIKEHGYEKCTRRTALPSEPLVILLWLVLPEKEWNLSNRISIQGVEIVMLRLFLLLMIGLPCFTIIRE
ncbi:MAG: asparaginase domain-containing protein [Bacteroidales bacterium]